uniref:Uncharacterized protein n=1 Tax=Arundo donax TaxID=35708 RepID=A0A0A9HHL4_ARUDO
MPACCMKPCVLFSIKGPA